MYWNSFKVAYIKEDGSDKLQHEMYWNNTYIPQAVDWEIR